MSERRRLAPPRDLTVPVPGSTTARDVLSHAVGRLLRELRPLLRTHASLAPASDIEAFDRLLATALVNHVGPMASVLRRPNVGALVRTLRTETAPERQRDLLRELYGLLSFELAILGELPFEVRFREFPRRLVSLAADVVVEMPEDAGMVSLRSSLLSFTRGKRHDIDLEALREGGSPDDASGIRVRRPFSTIDGSTRLALEDNNPLALDEAHPDKSGNAVDLGGASVTAWVESLRGAFKLVETYLPELRAEMELYLAQIVPVGALEDKHLSASFREAIGTVYLTLHPHPMTMVEALIHEFQHNKLNALLETDDVLENAFLPLYPSPVRPDLRPLHGVLLAVHAFLPVARLYEAMIARGHPLTEHPSFRRRLGEIVAINQEGASVVLQHGKPTVLGAGLLDEIRRLSAR